MNKRSSKTRSRTDWKRVLAMRDDQIDLTEIPQVNEAWFREAVFVPGKKQQVTLRIDPDVIAFFRKQGRGYQTAINAVLRKYMQARKRKPSSAAD